MSRTPARPTACAWPTNDIDMPPAPDFDPAEIDTCDVKGVSFYADHGDRDQSRIDLCGVHAPHAVAAGWEVRDVDDDRLFEPAAAKVVAMVHDPDHADDDEEVQAISKCVAIMRRLNPSAASGVAQFLYGRYYRGM